jgi:hypothetical protein
MVVSELCVSILVQSLPIFKGHGDVWFFLLLLGSGWFLEAMPCTYLTWPFLLREVRPAGENAEKYRTHSERGNNLAIF